MLNGDHTFFIFFDKIKPEFHIWLRITFKFFFSCSVFLVHSNFFLLLYSLDWHILWMYKFIATIIKCSGNLFHTTIRFLVYVDSSIRRHFKRKNMLHPVNDHQKIWKMFSFAYCCSPNHSTNTRTLWRQFLIIFSHYNNSLSVWQHSIIWEFCWTS